MATTLSNSATFGLFHASPSSGVLPTRLSHGPSRDSLTAASDLPLAKRLQMIREREGEDAVLTGGTRSLHRRLLALNIQERMAAPRSAHSTQARSTPLSA